MVQRATLTYARETCPAKLSALLWDKFHHQEDAEKNLFICTNERVFCFFKVSFVTASDEFYSLNRSVRIIVSACRQIKSIIYVPVHMH